MKLIIAGGKDYELDGADYDKLDKIKGITEVVSGGASGADGCGEFWAGQRNLPVKRFLADWGTHGKAAGPIRNRDMAEYADAVALFPGGAGTASMRTEAKRAGISIYDFTK
jgi:hypothetical protein